MFSIDYGLNLGFLGYALLGLLFGVAVIAAIWLFTAVRSAQKIVEEEVVQPPPVQPPVDPQP